MKIEEKLRQDKRTKIQVSGFLNFSALNTAGADIGATDSSAEINLDPLKIGKKAAQSFTDDLGTGTTFSFDHTASFIFNAGDGPFVTNFACFSHGSNP